MWICRFFLLFGFQTKNLVSYAVVNCTFNLIKHTHKLVSQTIIPIRLPTLKLFKPILHLHVTAPALFISAATVTNKQTCNSAFSLVCINYRESPQKREKRLRLTSTKRKEIPHPGHFSMNPSRSLRYGSTLVAVVNCFQAYVCAVNRFCCADFRLCACWNSCATVALMLFFCCNCS